MATATLLSLRGRMTPPSRRRAAPRPLRKPEVDRLLRLATDIFPVAVAALVLAGPDGLAVEAVSCAEGDHAEPAIAAARRLFEVLVASEGGEAGRAGVMEEVEAGHGFRAATPILSPLGRCFGALCLLDTGRKALLNGLQRRLFSEFGDLMASALGGDAEAKLGSATDPGARPPAASPHLQDLADRDADAIALFDLDGRCLLRNRRFEALLGRASPAAVLARVSPALVGDEAGWLARHLARNREPVGVYRASLADGTWLCVEERRGPYGRSLVARVEARDAFGEGGDMRLLFERCPLPMFVFDRDTRAILAVNEAALALYGWDRDAFLRLDLDGLGQIGAATTAAGDWTHRTRDGRPLPVSGRTVGVDHRGRPAVLVTVTAESEDLGDRGV